MSKISIDSLADEIIKGLNEYKSNVNAEMKKAVRRAANVAKNEIKENAPEDTGKYAKSWAVKIVEEKSNAFSATVYSKNRYQIAHLLEHGHAKRNGGRVAGKAHIAPAEAKAVSQLEYEIERNLKNG